MGEGAFAKTSLKDRVGKGALTGEKTKVTASDTKETSSALQEQIGPMREEEEEDGATTAIDETAKRETTVPDKETAGERVKRGSDLEEGVGAAKVGVEAKDDENNLPLIEEDRALESRTLEGEALDRGSQQE